MTESLNWVRSTFRRRPIVVATFNERISRALDHPVKSLSRFTISLLRESVFDVKPPTLCCAEFDFRGKVEVHLGLISGKQASTTLDSRVTFRCLAKVFDGSFAEMLGWNRNWSEFAEDRDSRVDETIHVEGVCLKIPSARQCDQILNILASLSLQHLDFVVSEIRPAIDVPPPVWQQKDAIKLAVEAFGLSAADAFQQENDSSVHLLEDYAIWDDATQIPGYNLIQTEVTGHRVFTKGDERLDVFMANKGPLETMLGVDLIYINKSMGSSVMIQYKMLEPAPNGTRSNWIFRPDNQFYEERSRMFIPPVSGETEDYRLNSSPFYFQFVKRKQGAVNPQSFIVSNDHLTKLLSRPEAKGPKGGVRISYEALQGCYLRRSDLMSLMHSGYVGSHRVETEALVPLIEAVAAGNRALVLAWQQKSKKNPDSPNRS